MMAVAALTLCSTLFFMCKKESASTSEQSTKTSMAAALGNPDNFTEDQITSFISDIRYYHNSDQQKTVNAADGINKMEAAFNYVFSDIDTPYQTVTTSNDYTFNFTANPDGTYNMTDISSTMYNIKSYINQKLAADNKLRVMLGSIDVNPNGAGYMLTVYIGTADGSLMGMAAPAPPTVTTNNYEWGWGNKVNAYYGCTDPGQYAIQSNGGDYLKSLYNYTIGSGQIYAVIGGRLNIPYLSGRNVISVIDPTTNNATTWMTWKNTTSVSTTGFPTSSPASSRPAANALFSKGQDASVYPMYGWLAGSYQVLDYNWCLPADYINWYIAKVNDVWTSVRPSASTLPLFANPGYTNPSDLSLTDYIVHEDGPANCAGDIHHIVQYHYTNVKSKSVNYPIY